MARLAAGRNMKLLLVVSFTGMFNLYVALTALPLYVVQVGGSAFHAGLLSSIGLLAAVAFRFVFGPMTDNIGRRPPLIIGNAAFALAAAGLWLSDSVSEVAVVRVLQAVGPAAFISASSALAVDLSPPDMRATGLGLAGAFKSLGAAVGPPVAIALAGSSGFAAVFFVCFIVGAVGVAVSVLLQEDRSPVRDPAAAAPADRRPVRGLGPWREVLDPYWSRFAALTAAVLAMAQGSILTFVPLFGQAAGVGHHGVYFTVLSVAGVAGGLAGGALSDRLGRVKALFPMFLVYSAGVVLLTAFPSVVPAMLSAVLAGFGFTGNIIVLGSMMAEHASPRRTGIVFALQESAVDVGMGVGAFVLGLTTEAFGYGASFLGLGAGCAAWALYIGLRSRLGPPHAATGRHRQ